VFKGEDSLGVIRRARELGALCVRGNHDDKVVRLKTYLDRFGSNAMMQEDSIMPEGKVGDPLRLGNKHVNLAKFVILFLLTGKQKEVVRLPNLLFFFFFLQPFTNGSL
jgi:hypothetical protein